MWGNIVADLTYQTNYHVSFPESQSDVILSLTIWQYWWWFWFTYLLTLYYFLFLYLIRKRMMKFNPKMVTSYRAHGKWGDFIICILPISWCINILSNSNFILRMMEWQTESNLFTVRVRGKQWYWIYKLEIKSSIITNQTNKNVGHNYWTSFQNPSLDYNNKYLNITQLKSNSNFLITNKNLALLLSKFEFNGIFNLNFKINKNLINIMFKSYYNLITNFNSNKDLINIMFKSYYNLMANVIENNKELFKYKNINNLKFNNLKFNNLKFNNLKFNNLTFNNLKFNNLKFNLLNNLEGNPSINNFSSLTFISEINRHLRTNNFNIFKNLKINWFNNKLLIKFNNSSQPLLLKHTPDNIYLVIKQKKYLTSKKIPTNFNIQSNLNYNSNINIKSISLLNNENFQTINIFKKRWNLLNRSNLNKTPNFSNMDFRRLLRTKRILVLPTGINITIITNSFDVVHSWYIPGLGIKLDCIPGRSTHHSVFIDHAGFYYGQCAEICGRHHHHMPIRICALPFEHFLIWWYHYGLTYYTAFKKIRKISVNSNLKQYNW